MATKNSIPKPPAITADGVEPLTPEQIVEHLRILRLHIPNYGPIPLPEAQAMRSTANVHDELLRNAADTIDASPFVAGAIGRDGEAVRNERTEVGRWGTVENELKAMYKGVASANLGRRHRLGLTALQTYSIARQLVRQPEHAHLLPLVDSMRRVARFGRRKRAPGTPEPEAQPPVPSAPPSK